MATTATADNWTVASVMLGAGRVYAGVSIPGAAARLTLHTDGSPDTTLSPNSKHLGMTEKGTEFMVKSKLQNYNADEFQDPIISSVDEVECVISGSFLQPLDLVTLGELLTPGVGTYATGAGFKELRLGRRALVYNSICVIAPVQADVTKFIVFHLYSAMNDVGLAAQIGRKTLSATPFAFRGYALTSRATTDTTGIYFVTI